MFFKFCEGDDGDENPADVWHAEAALAAAIHSILDGDGACDIAEVSALARTALWSLLGSVKPSSRSAELLEDMLGESRWIQNVDAMRANPNEWLKPDKDALRAAMRSPAFRTMIETAGGVR